MLLNNGEAQYLLALAAFWLWIWLVDKLLQWLSGKNGGWPTGKPVNEESSTRKTTVIVNVFNNYDRDKHPR